MLVLGQMSYKSGTFCKYVNVQYMSYQCCYLVDVAFFVCLFIACANMQLNLSLVFVMPLITQVFCVVLQATLETFSLKN